MGVSAVPTVPWRGHVWRAHHGAYRGDDAGGSRLFSGRYNRGLDLYPAHPEWDALYAAGEVWPALYVGLSWGVCMAELIRHLSPPTLLSKLRNMRLSELRLDLAAVLDCSDLTVLGVNEDQLFHDTDYAVGHALARRAHDLGCEALLVPSAARIPYDDARVMAVCPDLLQPGSAIRVVRTVTPNLDRQP